MIIIVIKIGFLFPGFCRVPLRSQFSVFFRVPLGSWFSGFFRVPLGSWVPVFRCAVYFIVLCMHFKLQIKLNLTVLLKNNAHSVYKYLELNIEKVAVFIKQQEPFRNNMYIFYFPILYSAFSFREGKYFRSQVTSRITRYSNIQVLNNIVSQVERLVGGLQDNMFNVTMLLNIMFFETNISLTW